MNAKRIELNWIDVEKVNGKMKRKWKQNKYKNNNDCDNIAEIMVHKISEICYYVTK